ncbi:MAG TPA: glycosyltransferase [Gemmataceae bacterium]|jgi:glycosyltransferase involved in cell wall biosynthesis|nr:glycosyltransferase [Gemmataceae bacterium]
MPRLHVAVLDEELPFPLTSGKRIRSFQLLTRLAKTHRVTYIAHKNADEGELREAAKALRDHDIFPIIVDRAVPKKSGPGFYTRLARNLVSPLPFSVATHSSRAFATAMDKLVQKDPPDLWHCEWTPYAQAMYRRRGRWVVMAHNVESVIWERYATTERNPLKAWFLRRQRNRFRAFESWAYANATRTIAVSREDAELIESRFGATDVAVVDNGVDTSTFQPDDKVTPSQHRMLFLGSLDWRPNQDAVKLLMATIYPKVRVAEPLATLSIVGRKPPEWMREAVRNRLGIKLFADVPDVLPYLQGAGMLVVPLRIGGGSRLKILEALATGVPVISTTIGAEGLRLNAGEHITVADSSDAFAVAVIEGIRRTESLWAQAARGRKRVLDQYDWSGLADKLGAVWESAACNQCSKEAARRSSVRRPRVPTISVD